MKEDVRSRRRHAVVALVAVTLFWGCSFIWMKQSLDAAARVLGRPAGTGGVALYLALRFAAATILLAASVPGARRGLGPAVRRGGLTLAVPLAAGFVLQMRGLEGISPAVSAFLTSLYVVFVAAIAAAGDRARPHRALWIGAALATFGAGFISGPPHLTFGLGEWLTVGCAAVFAVQIVLTDRVTKRLPPLPVTTAMFAWTAACAAGLYAFLVLVGRGPSLFEAGALVRDAGFTVPLALSTVFASVASLTLMNLYQRELDPVRAGILYSLEPVWTSIIAIALGFDHPRTWLLIGGTALLAGNLVAELGDRREIR